MQGTSEFEKFSKKKNKRFDDEYQGRDRKRSKKKPRERHLDKRAVILSKHETRED